MSSTSTGQLFLWVALPYLALGFFVVGHVWRWRYDQFGWTSRSTQLQERDILPLIIVFMISIEVL